jgi:ferredoxin-thioredoxin reductase catalytic subunit
MTEIEKLYEMLKKIQEPKGYLFSTHKEKVLELLEGLIANRTRYGYMSCPCRLASGKRDKDRDIICPCEYREDDVREYGSCYCNLYVSREWNDGTIEHIFIPERRPLEKSF